MDWKEFENLCLGYLVKNYSNFGNKDLTFFKEGGSDSHAADINVYKNNSHIFSIEVKMPNSQCGQFVLLPDVNAKKFIFSKRNVSPVNEPSKKIIEHMNDHFDSFLKSGTRGEKIDMDSSILYEWIKSYYKNIKKESFIITAFNDQMVIFPIDKIEDYFEVSACYRIKKSGSSRISYNNLNEIKTLLNNRGLYGVSFNVQDSSITINAKEEKFVLKGNMYDYLLIQKNNKYNIRRLSNTYNANVIFSINAKSTQKKEDLQKFEEALLK